MDVPLFSRFNNFSTPAEILNKDQRNALDGYIKKLSHNIYNFEEASCICGMKNGKLIARCDRYALSVNTYLCYSCGVMWTNPRMTENSLKRFYEEDYRPIYLGKKKATDSFFNDQIIHGQYILDFFSTIIPIVKGWKVFDIGCGAGGTLIPFLNAGFSPFGCDVGLDYLEYGRRNGLVLEHGDISSLTKFRPANLVILSHVLEHFSNPKDILTQIYELLFQDGYVYVELPGIFNIHKAYGDTLLFLQNAHLYHFTLTTLASLFAKAGFKLVKGDEIINALFQKCDKLFSVSTENQYNQILKHLYFVEFRRKAIKFFLIPTLIYLIKKLTKMILGDNLVTKAKRIFRCTQI